MGTTGEREAAKGRLRGEVGERIEAVAPGSQAAGCELGMRSEFSKTTLGPTSSGEKGVLDSLKGAGFESYSIPSRHVAWLHHSPEPLEQLNEYHPQGSYHFFLR